MDIQLVKQAIAQQEITPLRGALIMALSEHLPIKTGEQEQTYIEKSETPQPGFTPVKRGLFIDHYRKEVTKKVSSFIADEDALENLSEEKLKQYAQPYKAEVNQYKKLLTADDSKSGSVQHDEEIKQEGAAAGNSPATDRKASTK